MQTYTFRLKPGELLLESLEKLAQEKNISAGVILTCVGSLTHAAIRYANSPQIDEHDGHFEIVSLVGTFSTHGAHVHISISDGEGAMIGGHLWQGCKVYTTAEIVVGIFPDLAYTRQPCEFSGYDELVVEKI
ncbi:MAG: DNA-binding protein [Anaerolineaceae bacterium]|nr:DNA-binding protein [Anaerolineaceae bacterium]